MKVEEKLVLCLIRSAYGCQSFKIDVNVDWQEVFDIACKQGVSCLVFDAVDEMAKNCALSDIPSEFTLQLYAQKTQIINSMLAKQSLILEFAELMLPYQGYVLKGLDFARYWRNPLYREYGDFDCFYGADFENVNRKAVEKGLKKDEGTSKHSHIYYNDLMVENHYTLTDYDGSKIGSCTEYELRKLLNENNESEFIIGNILSPSKMFTACFMLKHAQMHFMYEGIELRHFLDWMYFVDKTGDELDWGRLNVLLDEMKLHNFAGMMTAYCKTRLGWENKSVEKIGTMADDSLLNRVDDFVFSEKADVNNRNIFYLAKRIMKRFVRAWHFRKLHYLPYLQAIWTWIAYASFLNRRPKEEYVQELF